jgi:hypothetical protein
MHKLLIKTQIYENYGYRWKAKGDSDYVIKNFNFSANEAGLIVSKIRSRIEYSNDSFIEKIIDWKIVPDDYLTEFEQSQLDYEGFITYHPAELSIGNLNDLKDSSEDWEPSDEWFREQAGYNNPKNHSGIVFP